EVGLRLLLEQPFQGRIQRSTKLPQRTHGRRGEAAFDLADEARRKPGPLCDLAKRVALGLATSAKIVAEAQILLEGNVVLSRRLTHEVMLLLVLSECHSSKRRIAARR